MRYVISLILVCSVFVKTASGTAQINERIFLRGEIRSLHSTPLESYFDDCWMTRKRIGGQVLHWGATNNYRGYVATWELKGDTLFLRKVETKSFKERDRVTIDLVKEFGTDRVVADWYTGRLTIPRGAPTEYMHLGFGYEYEFYEMVEIENGLVVRQYLSFTDEESRATYLFEVDEELLCSINSLDDALDYMPNLAQLISDVEVATEKRIGFLKANDGYWKGGNYWVIEIFPDESLPSNQLRYNWFNRREMRTERFGYDTGVLILK